MFNNVLVIYFNILLFSGYFIIFEVYSDEDLLEIKLDDIPKKVMFSFIKEELTLVGIINYKSPVKHTRHSKEEIGHYTAICYRKNNKWVQYDDCKVSEVILSDKHIVCPNLILYSI